MTAGARRCRRGRGTAQQRGDDACIVPSLAQVARWLARWSGRPDSNWRPPAPHAGALPGCATPRPDNRRISHSATGCNSVAHRHFQHALAPDFWHSAADANAATPANHAAAHTGFVYPVVARANRYNRPRYSECNPASQPPRSGSPAAPSLPHTLRRQWQNTA